MTFSLVIATEKLADVGISSRELVYPQGTLEDEFPFPKVGYVPPEKIHMAHANHMFEKEQSFSKATIFGFNMLNFKGL